MLPECGALKLGREQWNVPAEIYFPISSTRSLLLSWHGRDADHIIIRNASAGLVRMVNIKGMNESRFIFARKQPSFQMQQAMSRRKAKKFRRLAINDGDNGFRNSLKLFAQWAQQDFGGATNAICMAPTAPWSYVAPGVRVSVHEWDHAHIRQPVARDMPSTMATATCCKHCGHGKIILDDGGATRYQSMEVLLAKKKRNWWDRSGLTFTAGG